MEEWRDIVNFPGYQVSDAGRVRSHNKVTSSARFPVRHWKDRVLKPKINPKDRISRYSLWKDGKEYTVQAHRLVAEAFIPGDTSLTVNHKDGNRQNNTVDNLEWLSIGDNIRHAFITGLATNQKACRLVDESGRETIFHSQAEASRYIGRSTGYINAKIMHGGVINSASGKRYRLV
jgi:hypothetical protein